jgi:hypothetical protein
LEASFRLTGEEKKLPDVRVPRMIRVFTNRMPMHIRYYNTHTAICALLVHFDTVHTARYGIPIWLLLMRCDALCSHCVTLAAKQRPEGCQRPSKLQNCPSKCNGANLTPLHLACLSGEPDALGLFVGRARHSRLSSGRQRTN